MFLPVIVTTALFALASAKVLVSYDAAKGDPTSNLDLLNLQGYDRAPWPKAVHNSSLFFETSTDPNGVRAAHVHKAPHFVRAEYHMLKTKNQPVKDTTYYIGYKVRFDRVDNGLIVFQWKNYKTQVDTDNIPIALVFVTDNVLEFRVSPNPSDSNERSTVWTQRLTMKKTYQFGIVVNTSQTNGFVQLYFNGQPTGEKVPGNYFPGGMRGAASPKVGLYGNKNPVVDDSYIYGVVVGTTMGDICEVAGIPV